MRLRTLILAGAAVLGATAAPLALAQAWPSRPITIINPYAAGGPTDIVARMLAQRLSESLGQPVVVSNAPGASTMIGAEKAARSPADGYTLFIGSVTTFSNNPLMYKKIRYKVEDFAPISMIARTPYTMTVAPNLPTKDFAEFVAYARQRPGKVFNATTGIGATNQLLGQMLNSEAGIQLADVAYKGSGPALLDVMGGQVDLTFDGINTSAQALKAGKVRVLAVTSEKRSSAMPDVPTFAELGYPKMNASFWYGMFAPTGTPQPIIERLNREIGAALRAEDIRNRLVTDGLTVEPSTPQALSATITRDSQLWGPVIKALGIELE
ncbi:MAG: tripartite tricarboxylate transporter substrate binding protein [Burkholderiales bacterium]|nr:tripartite tricarboxylate transporter substrate binding protein [Burkholderiales bacterium]